MVTQVKTPNTPKLAAAPKHKDEQVHAAHDADTGERVYARFAEAQDALLKFFGAPSWKRSLVACISGLVVLVGGSIVLTNIVEWLIVGSIMSGASTFLAMAVAAVAAIIGAVYISKKAARVFGSVLTGEADDKAIAAYDATKSFFKRLNPLNYTIKPVEVA